MVKSNLLARSKANEVTQIPITRLRRIICLAEIEKILAIAAGRTKSAVIKKMPTIFTDKATVTASKTVKDKFHNFILKPSILARSLLMLINKVFLKPKIV